MLNEKTYYKSILENLGNLSRLLTQLFIIIKLF